MLRLFPYEILTEISTGIQSYLICCKKQKNRLKTEVKMGKEIKLIWVLMGSLLTSIGMSFIWPLTSVYLHDKLAISLSVIGIVLFFNSMAAVVGSIVAGYLFDRYNPYYLAIIGGLFTTLVLVCLIFFHGWPVFPIALFFLGLGSGWNTTLVSAIGARMNHYDGRYVFNMIYFAQNLGVVFGTAVVGFVYSISISLLFAIASIVCFAYTLIAFTTYRPIQLYQHAKAQTKEVVQKVVSSKNLLLINSFFIALFVIWIMYQQWVSNLSVYMTGLGIPLSHYSLLWTLNAGLIVLVQLVLVKLAKYINTMVQIFFGLTMLAISFFVLVFAKEYGFFVVAMIILTLGEATAFPAIPALVNQLTPASVKGRYLGMANSFTSAGRAVGPLVGGIIIDRASYETLFEIATIVNIIVVISLIIVHRKTKKDLHFYEEETH
jgi:MFS family permease